MGPNLHLIRSYKHFGRFIKYDIVLVAALINSRRKGIKSWAISFEFLWTVSLIYINSRAGQMMDKSGHGSPWSKEDLSFTTQVCRDCKSGPLSFPVQASSYGTNLRLEALAVLLCCRSGLHKAHTTRPTIFFGYLATSIWSLVLAGNNKGRDETVAWRGQHWWTGSVDHHSSQQHW